MLVNYEVAGVRHIKSAVRYEVAGVPHLNIEDNKRYHSVAENGGGATIVDVGVILKHLQK